MWFGNAAFPLVQTKIIDFFKIQRTSDASQILNHGKLNLIKLIIDYDIYVLRFSLDGLIWALFGLTTYLKLIAQVLMCKLFL